MSFAPQRHPILGVKMLKVGSPTPTLGRKLTAAPNRIDVDTSQNTLIRRVFNLLNSHWLLRTPIRLVQILNSHENPAQKL